MKLKFRLLAAILMIAVFSVAFLPYQESISAASLEQQYDETASKLRDAKKNRDDISEQLKKAKENLADKQKIVALLYEEIDSYQTELNLIGQLITEYNALIAEKEKQIEELNAKMDKNYELFKERLIFAQESGTMSYIDFILGSSDLSDILSRGEVINDMLDYDRQIIESLISDREEITRTKAEVEEALKLNEEKKAEYNTTLETLNAKAAEAQAYVNSASDDVNVLNAQLAALNKSTKKLEDDLDQLAKDIASKAQGGSTTFTGQFIWPLPLSFPGYISQGFSSTHSGMDIAVGGWKNNGKIPALASAAGTVVRTGLYWDWGNLVVVDHGGGYLTYYAHLNRISVSVGQHVAQGQQVGMIGSTGDSTGPHLHIVFYENGVRVDPARFITHP